MKFISIVFALFFIALVSVYSENIKTTETNTPKIFCMPIFSYKCVSFDNIQTHNIMGGLILYRFNPEKRDNLFSVSLMYTPNLLIDQNPDFPDLFHTAALSVTQKINNHTISGSFISMTDKPLYGGLRTFIGMAGYSYALIKGPHFSMDLGGKLLIMDIGLTLNNGIPWLIWPIPSISLSLEYKWVSFGLNSGLWMTIAPKSPVSLILKSGSHKYDASIWYHHFKNGNPKAEIVGIGIGTKKESSNAIRSDGMKYGISYDTIYGTLRLFKIFEINAGLIFNGNEGYESINWETLFESNGYSDDTMYSGDVGDGFFIAVSIMMNF